MNITNQRYKVDERCGCAAIVDTFWPNESNCLDSDSVGVIRYESLPREENDVRLSKLTELDTECKRLNESNTITKERVDAVISKFIEVTYDLQELFPKIHNVRIS